MKTLLIVMMGMTFSIASQAASPPEPLVGYVVMANNDTVKCKIKTGRFLENPFTGIKIINEQGEEHNIRPKDKQVIAFGFFEKFRWYHFLLIEAGDRSEHGYYQRLVYGNYKLYCHPVKVQYQLSQYVLFNPAGQFIKFETAILTPWKRLVKELLKDDAKALEAAEQLTNNTNIPLFVRALNKDQAE